MTSLRWSLIALVVFLFVFALLSGCAGIAASANKMEVITVCSDGRVIQQTAHGGEAVRIFKETFKGCDDQEEKPAPVNLVINPGATTFPLEPTGNLSHELNVVELPEEPETDDPLRP